MNHKVPIRVDGKFRLGDVLGSGSYTVVYHARNIIKDDAVAIKLESITAQPSSVQCEYAILKQLEGGVGIPRALWFGRESTYHALVLGLLGPSLHDLFLAHDRKFSLHTVVNLGIQLLSCLEYIHSNNYVHCDIKPQNVLVGLGHLKHTAFIIDFSIAKEYWDTATRVHIPFHQNQRLTGTPAFASINNHLGVDPGRRDDLESLTYMLIYLLCSSLPWLTSDHKKLSSSSILERKVNTTIEVLCDGIPIEFTSVLIYMCSLAFSEDPDYGHLRSLFCGLQATLAVPSTCSLDFSMPNNHITHHPPISNEH
ncbi:kinase-like domain-containing protein [Suillus paluster]|uniref:kinase-like domain-containing protein n=1 Tax=Suillus paluster TaxID=48578 RepID=UPI001B85DAF7|nr:kinase-like domain-containing protein [Suillus paluster]KAG1750429.1 kinase-like domain-containing protein [Suillus paluster]